MNTKKYSEQLKNFKTGGMCKESEVSDVANDEDRFSKELMGDDLDAGHNRLSNKLPVDKYE